MTNNNFVSSTHRELVQIDVGGTIALPCTAYRIQESNSTLLFFYGFDEYGSATKHRQGGCISINRNDAKRQTGFVKKRKAMEYSLFKEWYHQRFRKESEFDVVSSIRIKVCE